MKIRRLNDDFLLHIIILLLCLAPVVFSMLLSTDGITTGFRIPAPVRGIGLPCVFKTATGYNCPVCGMTRCFIYMSSLNIKAAWGMSKAGVLLYIFCVLQVPYRTLLIINANIPFKRYLIVVDAVFLIIIGFIAAEQFVSQFVSFF